MQGNVVVTVDNNFARFGDKSYAINKINTVEVQEVCPHKMGFATMLLGLAAAVLVFIAFLLLMGGSFAGCGVCLLFAFVLGSPCIGAYERAQTRHFTLVLMTSSSETQAFTSTNRDEVDSLRVKIEQAMVGRSLEE